MNGLGLREREREKEEEGREREDERNAKKASAAEEVWKEDTPIHRDTHTQREARVERGLEF